MSTQSYCEADWVRLYRGTATNFVTTNQHVIESLSRIRQRYETHTFRSRNMRTVVTGLGTHTTLSTLLTVFTGGAGVGSTWDDVAHVMYYDISQELRNQQAIHQRSVYQFNDMLTEISSMVTSSDGLDVDSPLITNHDPEEEEAAVYFENDKKRNGLILITRKVEPTYPIRGLDGSPNFQKIRLVFTAMDVYVLMQNWSDFHKFCTHIDTLMCAVQHLVEDKQKNCQLK